MVRFADTLGINVNRRRFLSTSVTTAMSFGVARYARANSGIRFPAMLDESAANHLLNRAAFGRGGKLTVQSVQAKGLERWLTEQLQPKQIVQSENFQSQINGLTTITQTQTQLLGVYQFSREEQMAAIRLAAIESRKARLLSAIYSEAQLSEVMTAFWFNHFNVFEAKDQARMVIGHYDTHAIRPHVFGRFRDLLGATSRHPAMLIYLDNGRSFAGRINENYAREVMELHTVGVDGGYSQSDVTALARMFTGWTFIRSGRAVAGSTAGPIEGDVFRFDQRRHDDGVTNWFGQTITVKGEAQADFALDFLAQHPATANRIAFKLAQYFVADEPPKDLVQRLAKVYLQSDGLIADVLRALFTDAAFWSASARGTKFKTPYEFAISMMRVSSAEVQNLQPLLSSMQLQGQALFGCQTPDGYKNIEAAWLTPESLNHRIQFATNFGAGNMSTLSKSGPLSAELLQLALKPILKDKSVSVIASAAPELKAGLMLSTPEFMRR